MDNKQNPAKILSTAIVIILTFIIGHGSAIFLYSDESSFNDGVANPINRVLGGSSDEDLAPEDMEVFWEVYTNLKGNYIEGEFPSDDEFVQGATKGMLAALEDRYTNYYTPEEWQEIKQQNSGQFQGVGIRLQTGEDGYTLLESLINGSPAAESGLMAGDLIMEVDDESIQGLSLTKVAEKIRGEKGTKVKLGVFRKKEEKIYDFDVTRDEIDVDSVETEKIEGDGFKITINKFTESSYSEFQNQWMQAVDEAVSASPEFLILDLRNNSGGWVEAAKFVLEEFVGDDVLIMKEEDKDGNVVEIKTNRNGKLTSVPLVVLVNEGTASASEIVAGALQDLDRAKLVGKPTLGKGVEQTVIPTSDGGTVHIVFKRWLTPKGRNLSKDDALKPDKEVDISADDLKIGKDPQQDSAIEMIK